MDLHTLIRSSDYRRQFIGWLTVLGSGLFFYLATAIISWARPYVTITAPFYVFARFLLGFVIVCLTMAIKRQAPRCNRIHYLAGRTVTNAAAVFCFYQAVDVTTVASANILNMTYPLFVALFSWFMIRTQRDSWALGVVMVAMIGIWLILSPGDAAMGKNDYWGLLSGFFAGFSIIYLNLSRQYHDSQTILFYMFGAGALLMLPFLQNSLFWPNRTELFFLLSCSIAGVLGQYLLTFGFLYVTAVEGAVISSSRILIAALLGPLLVADPALSASGWLGAVLIFSANIVLAFRKPPIASVPQK
jgi:drug/metabolite transporter (DMT)-like permease